MPRLDALLARNLGCSRTAAARAIQSGQVRDAHGAVLDDRRAQIDAAALPFTVIMDDGDRHALHDQVHLMLNKPLGVVTALRDERHPTAYQLLHDVPLFPELRAIGRLDLDTTGLLLWTTDGQWVQRLTHPKRHISRTYQAALARPFQAIPGGFALDDGHRPTITALDVIERGDLHPALALPAEAALFARISVVGGAYHEVRRIFAALGSHVLALCRVAYGRLALPVDLQPGHHVSVDLARVDPV
jgi:16S rRNA pseudouridine516 synthase